MYDRYIKHILGDEDERFGKRGKRGKGRGRGRGRGQRGGFHQDGEWKNRRGGSRRYSDREGRNGDFTSSFKKQQQTDLNSSGTSNDSLSTESLGDKSTTECEMEESNLKNGIVNAVVVDVASVASAASKECSDQSEAVVEKTNDGSSHQTVASDLASVCGDEDSNMKRQLSCSGSDDGVGRKRRRRMEGRQNRRDGQRKKRKVILFEIVNWLPYRFLFSHSFLLDMYK